MRGSGRLRLLLVLLVLTAFTFTALDYRSGGGGSPFDALRRGSDTLFGPVQRTLGGAVRAVGGLRQLGSDRTARRRLQRENDALRGQLRATDGLRRQLDEQGALLGLRNAGGYALKAGHVSAVQASLGFEWTATIDIGSRQGVAEDQTVLNGRGLVGRVKRVGPYSATVVLVVDPDFSVGVRLVRSGQLGVATGSGRRGLTYELIGQRSRAEVGDALFTSGSTFAAGIPVGRVATTSNDPNTSTLTGTIEPYVDVTALDLIGVVTGGPRPGDRVPVPTP